MLSWQIHKPHKQLHISKLSSRNLLLHTTSYQALTQSNNNNKNYNSNDYYRNKDIHGDIQYNSEVLLIAGFLAITVNFHNN